MGVNMIKININATKLKKYKKSEKGMALVESIPVLFTLVIVFNFSLGFFGSIHSGILNSIGAYNYTLETFRFRSNLMYFRPGAPASQHYAKTKNRVHGVIQDGNSTQEQKGRWPATVRKVAFKPQVPDENSTGIHLFSNKDTGVWSILSKPTDDRKYRSDVNAPEIWIKTVYGICITADCKE